MSHAPKVSVVVVTFNHGTFLAECIDSALSQVTSFPFEVIVGDDASTDGSLELLRRYEARYPRMLRVVAHPINVGNARNIEAVVRASRGEYIAHLDGDDFMLPGKLAAQAALLDARSEMALCFHDMVVYDAQSRSTGRLFTGNASPRVSNMEGLVRHGTVYCHSSKMYRRTSLAEPPVDLGTRRVIDWLMHIQSARTGTVGYIDDVLGGYRKHDAAVTASRAAKAIDDSLRDQLYTLRRAAELGASAEAVAAGTRRVLLREAVRYLEIGEADRFEKTIVDSWSRGFLGKDQALLYMLRSYPRAARRALMLFRQARSVYANVLRNEKHAT